MYVKFHILLLCHNIRLLMDTLAYMCMHHYTCKCKNKLMSNGSSGACVMLLIVIHVLGQKVLMKLVAKRV